MKIKAGILKTLIEALNVSVAEFEREIGASNASVVKAIERNSNLSDGLKYKILQRYPQINEDWLLTGNGDMFTKPESTPDPSKRRVPFIGEGLAGTDMELNVSDTPPEPDYIDVGDLLKDSEAAFIVYGNSMTPAYPPGCVLGIRRNLDRFIQPGETYLLLTKSNRIFKRLYYNDDKTGYVCVSDNHLKHDSGPYEGKFFYPPFEVHGDDVISVFDITGMIKRNRNSGIMGRQK